MSDQFFGNKPNKICRHLSGKVSKGRLRKPDNLQNHFNEEKRRKRQSEEKERRRREIKKCNDCILSFYNGYYGDHGIWPKKTFGRKGPLGDSVFKNPARYM